MARRPRRLADLPAQLEDLRFELRSVVLSERLPNVLVPQQVEGFVQPIQCLLLVALDFSLVGSTQVFLQPNRVCLAS